MSLLNLSERAKSQIDTCVHCGLCLEACPTYKELGIENDSPRGRIHLIRGIEDGQIAPSAGKVLEHLDACLACRACETACPSGVGYGAIIEDARVKLEPHRPRTAGARLLRSLIFRRLLPYPARLRTFARAARCGQRLKLHRLLLPGPLAAMADVAVVAAPFAAEVLPELVPAMGEHRYTVAFLTGCVMDLMFGPTNLASVRVLARNGCTVHIPRGQTCCGALPLHAGDAPAARELARQNIDAFLATGAKYFIINAAGCGSTMKEYHHLLDDPEYGPRAREFAGRVRDVSEFLAAIDLVEPTVPIDAVVAYQDACHLAHGQRVRLQPRKVLSLIPGVRLVPMADPEACCGSAGTYNITQPELSMAMLDRKMDAIAATGAAIVASGNPGCIVQMRLGARRRGMNVEILHVIDLLNRAYGGEGGYHG